MSKFAAKHRKIPAGRRRTGAAMLEAAIVLPILIMLFLGIIEMGRVMMLNQVATNAAREGARLAIVPGASNAAVTTAVNNYLDNAGVSGSSRSVVVMNQSDVATTVDAIPSKESVTIRISFPYSSNTWGFTRIMAGKTLVSEVTMRRE